MANEGEIKVVPLGVATGSTDITAAIYKPDNTIRDAQTAVALRDTDHLGLYVNLGAITIEAKDTLVIKKGSDVIGGGEYTPEVTVVAEDIQNAMKTMIGITVGGTWTWEKIMKITAAWTAGNWRLKADDANVQELLDAEDGVTVILRQSLTRAPALGNSYRDITVAI